MYSPKGGVQPCLSQPLPKSARDTRDEDK